MGVDKPSVILETSHPKTERNVLPYFFFFLIWVIWQS